MIERRVRRKEHFDGKTIFIRIDSMSQGNDENEQNRLFDHFQAEVPIVRSTGAFIDRWCVALEFTSFIFLSADSDRCVSPESISGFRHPIQSTVARTTRVLSTLLSVVAKSESHDKFKVTSTSVPYLAALVSVVEEVRTRCPVKNRSIIFSNASANASAAAANTGGGHASSHLPQSHSSTSIADIAGSTSLNISQGTFARRIKPWDPSYLDKTRKVSAASTIGHSRLLSIPPHARHYQSIDIENALPRMSTKPASTLVQLQPVKQSVPTIAVTPQILPESQPTTQVNRSDRREREGVRRRSF